jgi:hypothetical protein
MNARRAFSSSCFVSYGFLVFHHARYVFSSLLAFFCFMYIFARQDYFAVPTLHMHEHAESLVDSLNAKTPTAGTRSESNELINCLHSAGKECLSVPVNLERQMFGHLWVLTINL